MNIRSAVWIAVAIAGAVAGAFGTRLLASAPDIYKIGDVPFLDLSLVIPCLLLIAWAAVATLGKYSIALFYGVLALGIYGSSYGFAELVFHSLNQRPALSSFALLLFGLTILTSCYIANRLFRGRLGKA